MDKMEENKNGSEVQEEGTGMKGIIEEVNIDQEMRTHTSTIRCLSLCHVRFRMPETD